jgi:hypothetical protein
MAGIGRTPCHPVVTEDICDLQRRTAHSRRRLGRRLDFLAAVVSFPGPLVLWPCQSIERALDSRDHADGDVRVARGSL